MKRIFLSLLFLLAWSSQAYSYTFNFTDCTVTNRVFVWDNTNSYGECVDLTSVYSILTAVADTTSATTYVSVFESATGNLAPKTDAGLTYNASTGVLTATGGYDSSATTAPAWVFKDSDSGNASKEVASFTANYISGTSSPNANFYLQAMVAGSEFTYIESDVTNSQIKLNRKTNIASGIVKTITAKTATYTVLSTDFGQILTNTGATTAITFNLPAIGSTYIGQAITFVVMDAYNVVLEPNGTDWIMGPTNNPGDSLTCGTQGCTMTLRAIIAGRWVVESYYGTWTDTN